MNVGLNIVLFCLQVVTVAYSKCGIFLYSASLNSDSIDVWSASSGHLITEIKTNMDIQALCHIPEYNYLVVSGSEVGNGSNGVTQLWKGNLGRKIGGSSQVTVSFTHTIC